MFVTRSRASRRPADSLFAEDEVRCAKAEENTVKRRIRLRGINGDFEGKVWESDTVLRAGRLATLEIVLDDTSVSRRHSEVRSTANGWRVRDLGSTNGTFLNGNRLGPGEWPVRAHDILRCGNVTLVVDLLQEGREEDDTCQNDGLQVELAA